MNKLSREVDNFNSLYNSLFANLETAKNVLGLDLANAFVVQPAQVSKNIGDNLNFPPYKKTFYLILATLVGIFLGIFLVFFYKLSG